MRISSDGLHVMQCVTGVYIDGVQVMPNAGLDNNGGDFYTSLGLLFGGWNVEGAAGMYQTPIGNPSAVSFVAPLPAAGVISFFTDGTSRWAAQCGDGVRDSDGNFWTDRNLLGTSRQGDWYFVNNPGFTSLIVRSANRVEKVYPFGGSFIVGGMDRTVILYQMVGGAIGTIGAQAPLLPKAGPFTTDINGDRWIAGYQPGWGSCLSRWDLAPMGYQLPAPGGVGFNTAIQARGDGKIVVAEGLNQGETAKNVYVVDPVTQTVSVNGAAPIPLVAIDISKPPAEVEIPDLDAFAHPVLVTPFLDPDGESGQPSISDVGLYAESYRKLDELLADSANAYKRIIFTWDSAEDPVPPSVLRPHDHFWIEFYLKKPETLEQSAQRWMKMLFLANQRWGGDIGVIPMLYRQAKDDPNDPRGWSELWTVREVLDALQRVPNIINSFPRVKVVPPFAWRRANGITGNPEFRTAFHKLVKASPGMPTFTSIPSPPVPTPKPTPHPTPTPSPVVRPPSFLERFHMSVKLFRKSQVKPSGNPKAVRFTLPNPASGPLNRPGYVGNDALYAINDLGQEASSPPGADGGYEQFTIDPNKTFAYCSPGGQSGDLSYAVGYQE